MINSPSPPSPSNSCFGGLSNREGERFPLDPNVLKSPRMEDSSLHLLHRPYATSPRSPLNPDAPPDRESQPFIPSLPTANNNNNNNINSEVGITSSPTDKGVSTSSAFASFAEFTSSPSFHKNSIFQSTTCPTNDTYATSMFFTSGDMVAIDHPSPLSSSPPSCPPLPLPSRSLSLPLFLSSSGTTTTTAEAAVTTTATSSAFVSSIYSNNVEMFSPYASSSFGVFSCSGGIWFPSENSGESINDPIPEPYPPPPTPPSSPTTSPSLPPPLRLLSASSPSGRQPRNKKKVLKGGRRKTATTTPPSPSLSPPPSSSSPSRPPLPPSASSSLPSRSRPPLPPPASSSLPSRSLPPLPPSASSSLSSRSRSPVPPSVSSSLPSRSLPPLPPSASSSLRSRSRPPLPPASSLPSRSLPLPPSASSSLLSGSLPPLPPASSSLPSRFLPPLPPSVSSSLHSRSLPPLPPASSLPSRSLPPPSASSSLPSLSRPPLPPSASSSFPSRSLPPTSSLASPSLFSSEIHFSNLKRKGRGSKQQQEERRPKTTLKTAASSLSSHSSSAADLKVDTSNRRNCRSNKNNGDNGSSSSRVVPPPPSSSHRPSLQTHPVDRNNTSSTTTITTPTAEGNGHDSMSSLSRSFFSVPLTLQSTSQTSQGSFTFSSLRSTPPHSGVIQTSSSSSPFPQLTHTFSSSSSILCSKSHCERNERPRSSFLRKGSVLWNHPSVCYERGEYEGLDRISQISTNISASSFSSDDDDDPLRSLLKSTLSLSEYELLCENVFSVSDPINHSSSSHFITPTPPIRTSTKCGVKRPLNETNTEEETDSSSSCSSAPNISRPSTKKSKAKSSVEAMDKQSRNFCVETTDAERKKAEWQLEEYQNELQRREASAAAAFYICSSSSNSSISNNIATAITATTSAALCNGSSLACKDNNTEVPVVKRTGICIIYDQRNREWRILWFDDGTPKFKVFQCKKLGKVKAESMAFQHLEKLKDGEWVMRTVSHINRNRFGERIDCNPTSVRGRMPICEESPRPLMRKG